MNRDAEYILGLVAKEEYDMLRSVFRPGSLSLTESVFWFEENKNAVGGAPDPGRLLEEIRELCEEEAYAEVIAEAFAKHRIPVSERTVSQTAEAMKLFEELETLSDDVCARFLREGIEPTLRNLHTLRFEKDAQLPAAGAYLKEGEQALAWAFPEGKEQGEEELLNEAGLSEDPMGQQMLSFLKEKHIYVSVPALQMLSDLWSLSLPYEPKDAAEFAAQSLRRGIRPSEGLLMERAGAESDPSGAKSFRGDHVKNSEEEHLLSMEEKFAEGYTAKYGEEQYLDYEFTQYRRCLEAAEQTGHYLERYEIPITADHLSSFERLLDADGIFPILAGLLGEDELLALYEEGAMDEPHAKKVLKALWEAYHKDSNADLRRLSDYITAQKTFMLMEVLEEKGFFEVPAKEGETLLRVRVRRNTKGGFTAVIEDESIGGLSIRYENKDGEVSLLTVGSREETLEELRKRTEGKVSLTTLYSPEFPYGKSFF